ncbi:type II toxin-antitoxin system VapB family antitoxin [Streptomyces sp. NPDC006368]|uniref:type II toxin-antitoxin system VapB family antitoxin n=1 Tax=Streptomyces sp. NPDC006368 TaxID=3156760 RepID=UPI0033B18CA7
MSRTVVDLDDEALAEAAKELGTTTKRDTINTALREVTARYRRLRSLEDARQLVREGGVDIDILLDKRKYRGGLRDEEPGEPIETPRSA